MHIRRTAITVLALGAGGAAAFAPSSLSGVFNSLTRRISAVAQNTVLLPFSPSSPCSREFLVEGFNLLLKKFTTSSSPHPMRCDLTPMTFPSRFFCVLLSVPSRR